MKRVGLTVYGLNIQNDLNQMLELHTEVDRDSLIKATSKFIRVNKSSFVNDNEKEKVFKSDLFYVDRFDNDTGDELFSYIYGTVKTGEYGIESEIVDINTGAVTHKKGHSEAEVLPFYFCLAVPAGSVNRAIIAFQTSGIYGMKTIFEKNLGAFLKSLDPSYKLILGHLVPNKYIERFMKHGLLQKIRLIKYGVPHDVSERFGINNGIETTYAEYTIHRPIGFFENKGQLIKDCLSGVRACTSIVEIQNFEYDALKLEIKMGKTTKTINLKNVDRLIISEDITDSLDIINGSPTKDSIVPVMLETCKEYLLETGLIQ